MTKPLDPKLIPKYVNELEAPPVYKPRIKRSPCTGRVKSHHYTISMNEFQQQLLPPGFPMTTVWGYGGNIKDPSTRKSVYFESTPGATFEAVKGVPAHVQWVNNITDSQLFAVDPTLHWANPNNMATPEPPFLPFPPGYPEAQSPIPLVTHLHGGEVSTDSDGGPNTWFTADEEIVGPDFVTSRYRYPNEQEATTLWYHDHTLGTTRLSVAGGLAGFYLLRDPKNKIERLLPKGPYEIPLVIQDRSFNEDGSYLYPEEGNNPDIHPYWVPSFTGNTIMVNGKVWPNLNVKRRQYRFRFLNGSNARVYNLSFSNNMKFLQIGSDGGFLPRAVKLKELLIGPGERADVLVDFSNMCAGTSIILRNNANTPFPGGSPPDPETVGQIMQFTVLKSKPKPPKKLLRRLNKIPKFKPNAPSRLITLNVINTPNGPQELLLDGQKFVSPVSETPLVGSTEIWEVPNLANNVHPIHIHLIQFQILNRQKMDIDAYREEWTRLNGKLPLDHPTIPLPVEPFLIGNPIPPASNERGWKDTVLMLPGEVTRIIARWAPQDAKRVKPGENLFPFDPSRGSGYVWHCHILEHEDNEMMRPLEVRSCSYSTKRGYRGWKKDVTKILDEVNSELDDISKELSRL
ncbi:multicopper oxidase family protein [Vallitalea okinawensis]|uniref:multicopper oxidase family protein n=1 Tax=Vallitalea okinawensis TaxID=2078660 RepID=UPI000CFBF750|nr:multicopper oxidase [Vallitalea okinawensis]